MSGVATAIAASAVIGGIASNRAAKKQAKGQQKAIDATNALIGPWSDAGLNALPAVQSFVDNGANFADTQAFRDITNSAKAGGQYLSGNRATALTDYYATNFRPQRLNELMQIPTLGQASATNQAANLGNLYSAQGATKAAGVLGVGNSINSGINGLTFLNMYNQGQGAGNSLRSSTSINGYTDSDIRLKTNIEKIGEQDGINLYKWDWKSGGSDVGVIAQEIDPAFVREKDGYLQVNYDELFPNGIEGIA